MSYCKCRCYTPVLHTLLFYSRDHSTFSIISSSRSSYLVKLLSGTPSGRSFPCFYTTASQPLTQVFSSQSSISSTRKKYSFQVKSFFTFSHVCRGSSSSSSSSVQNKLPAHLILVRLVFCPSQVYSSRTNRQRAGTAQDLMIRML